MQLRNVERLIGCLCPCFWPTLDSRYKRRGLWKICVSTPKQDGRIVERSCSARGVARCGFAIGSGRCQMERCDGIRHAHLERIWARICVRYGSSPTWYLPVWFLSLIFEQPQTALRNSLWIYVCIAYVRCQTGTDSFCGVRRIQRCCFAQNFLLVWACVCFHLPQYCKESSETSMLKSVWIFLFWSLISFDCPKQVLKFVGTTV